jgi:hypothetical protein
MKRFQIEQPDADIISHSGLSLVGFELQRYTSMAYKLDTQVPLRHSIKHSDVVKSHLAMLNTDKNDFEAINSIESEFYFMSALHIGDIPLEATLRQRVDERAVVFLSIIAKASQDLLEGLKPDLHPLPPGVFLWMAM